MTRRETTWPTHPFGREITVVTLIDTFSQLRYREDRYRQLIILEKQLPPLPKALRKTEMALSGCENRVWLYHNFLPDDGALYFYVDSDGRIVRGLLTILLTAVTGKTPQQLAVLEPLALFDRLSLRHQLNSAHVSGLTAFSERVKEIANRYL